MIKGSNLIGRSVVDMDAAEKLGKVKEIIVQQDGERVAGFVVAHAANILGSGGTRRSIPASALNAIGPDAITVHGHGVAEEAARELDSLPRMSDVIGHKMMTQSGRLLGTIDDLLVNQSDGSIIGFTVGEDIRSKLENMFSAHRAHTTGYVRADADLQVGDDLIVVPDDAFVAGDPEASTPESEATARPADPSAQIRGWTSGPRGGAPRKSLWNKRTVPNKTSTGSDEVEGWIPGDFSHSVSGEPPSTKSASPPPFVDPVPPSAPLPDDRTRANR